VMLPIKASTNTTQMDKRYGITFVCVPSGKFLMGSNDTDKSAVDDEKPQHSVYVDEFWIMETPVTNAQYQRCVTANACTPPNNKIWNQFEYANHPVTHVNWQQANEYAVWAGGRLPTEAEWEKAARGIDGRIFPWANPEPDETLLNYNQKCKGTTDVGSYPTGASIYGTLDMAGNVWEWVADWYNEGYYAISPASNPLGPASGDFRVLRGGSWYVDSYYVRTVYRDRHPPHYLSDDVGFRVVRVSSP
jgi:eukaryotic-like serine/threonine-protein kinase